MPLRLLKYAPSTSSSTTSRSPLANSQRSRCDSPYLSAIYALPESVAIDQFAAKFSLVLRRRPEIALLVNVALNNAIEDIRREFRAAHTTSDPDPDGDQG